MSISIRKIKNAYHLLEAITANILYGFPGRKIKVIGVTGTDGKTTTSHMIHHMLMNLGKKASLISSVYAQVGGKIYDTGFHTTTPSVWEVVKYIRNAVNDGDEFFILETTAHALDQLRVWGIPFTAAVLTNITHEHINSDKGYDYFRTMANYAKAKSNLLVNAKIRLVNTDDAESIRIAALLRSKNLPFKSYSLRQSADYQWPNGWQLPVPGEYNRYNALAALAVCHELGMDLTRLQKSLDNFRLPTGRYEVVHDGRFKVIIDFAHTINGIGQVLQAIRQEHKDINRVIHVFGSAGLRDKSKRSLMGNASSLYSDVIILTEEDYRTEDPIKIAEQIADGINGSFRRTEGIKLDGKNIYTIIKERKKAIGIALKSAKPKDVIVITGKGHEQSLCRGNIEYPWSDEKAVKELVANYDK